MQTHATVARTPLAPPCATQGAGHSVASRVEHRLAPTRSAAPPRIAAVLPRRQPAQAPRPPASSIVRFFRLRSLFFFPPIHVAPSRAACWAPDAAARRRSPPRALGAAWGSFCPRSGPVARRPLRATAAATAHPATPRTGLRSGRGGLRLLARSRPRPQEPPPRPATARRARWLCFFRTPARGTMACR